MISIWGELKRRHVFKVGVAYATLAWLLILTVAIVFPFMGLPSNAALLVTVLVVAGFPIAIVLSWKYEKTPDGIQREPNLVAVDRARVVRGLERVVLVALALALSYVAIDHYWLTSSRSESVSIIGEEEAAPSRLPITTDRIPTASGGNNMIKIGILSPLEGSRVPATGKAHEASIMLAFENLGPIRTGSSEVNLQWVAWNDEGNAELSAELAVKLAEDEGAAAILGPVNSSSTAAVLSTLKRAGLEIPIVSSLSTAPDLIVSGGRDHNFFRLIFDDADRMAAYATFIQNEKRRLGQQGYLFLYEDDEYGRGLESALRSNFYSSNVESRTWCDVLATGDDSRCSGRLVDPGFYGQIAEGRVFNTDLLGALGQGRFNNIVLLGTIPGSIAFAKGLEAIGPRLSYYFVGSSKQLFDEAPNGSVTIGNPVLDPDRAPSPELYSQWNALLAEFEAKNAMDRTDFISTAYEAGVVLHGALRNILRTKQSVPSLVELRSELIEALEEQSFDALEPWRRIQFVEGQLAESPTVPIYRIGRGETREDPMQARAWVDIDVAPRFNYLEGPIGVNLTGHGVDSATVLLSRVNESRQELIHVRNVSFSGGKASIDFHVFRTGNYRISLDGASYSPTMAETEIVLASTYILSIIVAFFGAWVAVSRERTPLTTRMGRIALGVFAGFVLTFSSLYGNQIAGWFPFPSFGDEPVINALITGLIGGLVGPYILADVLMSWADILTPIHSRRVGERSAQVVELDSRERVRN